MIMSSTAVSQPNTVRMKRFFNYIIVDQNGKIAAPSFHRVDQNGKIAAPSFHRVEPAFPSLISTPMSQFTLSLKKSSLSSGSRKICGRIVEKGNNSKVGVGRKKGIRSTK